MLMGYNPACVLIMPMLGRKQHEYPRFRDCFVEDGNIAIYTRVGGNNRHTGFDEEELYEDPNFITTYDDDFDTTYGTYVFKVPEKWQADFDKIINDKIEEVSDEYYNYVSEFYPTLAEDGTLAQMFKRSE